MITAFVSHHFCSLHDTGWSHPDHQGRLPALVRAVHRDMLALHDHLLQVEAEPATVDDLLLVHTPEHVGAVRDAVGRASAEGSAVAFGAEGMVSGASWDAALAAAGAALTAVELVLRGEARNAFCATRPPGRDAAPGRAERHSIFNTAAVAARHLRERRGVGRVLVVDLGAGAPLGVEAVLAPGVRVVSVHAQRYPAALGEGAEGLVSVGLPPETGGADLLRVLEEAVEREVARERPDFVLLSLGLDVLSADPLGELALEPRDVHDLTAIVRRTADRFCDGRLVSVLEGGYAADEVGRAVVQHLRALADLPAA